MKKNILVIGGSRFAGRVFSMLAATRDDIQLHVVNRGNHPLRIPNVIEYIADRHNPEALAGAIPNIEFDALVDFCAYDPGDIKTILTACGSRLRKYVFISTCSVYIPQTEPCNESTPVIPCSDGSSNGDYVLNKVALERELVANAPSWGVIPVIIRPSFIYGPLNYAPRENLLIQCLVNSNTLPQPTDAFNKFQMVYVKDLALALLAAAENDNANNQILNISAPEIINYTVMNDALVKAHGQEVERICLPSSMLFEKGFPLPFPVMGNELFDGSKAQRLLGLTYTPFERGMKMTYEAFKPLAGKQLG